MAKRARSAAKVQEKRGFMAYIRVSTDDQAESGLGLAAQRQAIAAYAQLYEVEIVDVIVDDGWSGSNIERPGMQRLLAAMESGSVAGVIVSKLDRLSRSVRDMGSLVETFFQDGRLRLVSVGEQIDTGSASGRLVLNMLTAVAQWEREAIGERTSAALRAKVARGEHLGTAPYGQSYDVESHSLVVNEDEQAILAEILRLDADGMATTQIARTLNERGTPARGKQWYQPAVWKLLAKHRVSAAA
jgi:site-specific DNA recombinase